MCQIGALISAWPNMIQIGNAETLTLMPSYLSTAECYPNGIEHQAAKRHGPADGCVMTAAEHFPTRVKFLLPAQVLMFHPGSVGLKLFIGFCSLSV